jgi:hypothetical protein
MNVFEVIRLADWFDENTESVREKFSALVSVLQNNSQQPTQQPVTPPLNDLLVALAEMPTDQLSTTQLDLLEKLQVDNLLGSRGRSWVNRAVRSSTYDPATTYRTIQEAASRLDAVRQRLGNFRSHALDLQIEKDETVDPSKPFAFSVVFKNGAAINNIRDWRKSAQDWEYILSSVAAVAGDRPEDVSVITAESGSIIVWLGAGAALTKILATVSKNIASMANDYVDFQLKKEELRRSRMMSTAIENDLKRQEAERRDAGKAATLEQVRLLASSAKPEDFAKLDKAVDKLIEFFEKGGDMDFINPALETESDTSGGSATDDDASTVDEVIREFRKEVQKAKLLADLREGKSADPSDA